MSRALSILLAVLLGLLLVAFMAGVGYINDFVIGLTYLVGNHFPIFVFGGLVVFLGVNVLLRLVGLDLSRKQIAIIIAMMLAASCIPGSGLMRTFTTTLGMPAQLASQKAAWQRNEVLSYVPDHMLASKVVDGRVVRPYLQGKRDEQGQTQLGDIPWEMTEAETPIGVTAQGEPIYPQVGWERPMKFWLPLVALVFVGLLGLGMVVHRQWSANELLRYPIVEFADGVMQRDKGRLAVNVFSNQFFWIGLAVAGGIHLVNGTFAWTQSRTIEIPMVVNMSAAFRELWPELEQTGKAWGVISPRLFISVAAFSYLLASEIGLSVGISNLLYCATAATFISYGVSLQEEYWMGGPFSFQTFGSYLGVGVIIIYSGRNFYASVLMRAFGLKTRTQIPGYSVWGARVFLACMIGACVWLTTLGQMDWLLAVVLMLLVTLMLLVIGRINAETGLFFVQPGWPVIGVIVGAFGMEALGPKMLIIMGLVVTVLAADPRESIMPYVLNGLKLNERSEVSPGKAGPIMAIALLAALAIGVPAVLWAQYHKGISGLADDESGAWGTRQVPSFTYDAASQEIDKLRSAELLDTAGSKTGLARLTEIDPDNDFLTAAGIGLGLVLLVHYARLRWNWWPIHPILFLVWMTNPLAHFAPSFLFGWVIRTLVVKLGGGKAYQKVKPLMYGLIAGDLLGGLLFMGLGAGYYVNTGHRPNATYQIFPL